MLISRNWNSGKRGSSYIRATFGVFSSSWTTENEKEEKELVFRINADEENNFQILKLRISETEAHWLLHQLQISLGLLVLDENLEKLIKSNNFIDAVKKYRAFHSSRGCTLKEAKDYCDKLRDKIQSKI